MKPPKHTTAKASYYNTRAEHYDEFNENNSKVANALLEKILKEHHVTSVLDLTCGTGSQIFWLADSGFEVVGKAHTLLDWTKGCIAVTNEEMDEIYDAVKIGTKVEILP